jgi:mannose-6-phosphate isomerase-like protein (cupin superfamily)
MTTRIVKKPWGHEEIWAETESYVGKVLVINPGHRLSRQYHAQKEETFRVLSGFLTLEIGQGSEMTTLELRAGDSYHCPPGTIHRMICSDKEYESVKVLEVSTNHLDDVVRLEDDYKR